MALADELSALLADTVTLYLKAHGYHWNIEGSDFPEYHEFFGDIYTDVYDSIDPIAENIRKQGAYAPFTMTSLQKLSSIPDGKVAPNSKAMATDLLKANSAYLLKLKLVCDSASQSNEQGLCNYLAERIDQHQKWQWQLTAATK